MKLLAVAMLDGGFCVNVSFNENSPVNSETIHIKNGVNTWSILNCERNKFRVAPDFFLFAGNALTSRYDSPKYVIKPFVGKNSEEGEKNYVISRRVE